MQPERPTVATHAGTVAPGFLELEWGAQVDRVSTDEVTVPLQFKLGLRKTVQLGISTPFNANGGFGGVGIAVKARLAEDAPLLGRFAIQPSVVLPTGGSATEIGVLLISSHTLGSVAFDANLGVFEYDGAVRELWTLSFGGPWSGGLGWVAEFFGTIASSGNSKQFLVGPTWSLRRWFALDAGIIVGLNSPSNTSYYFGGVTNFGRLVGR